MGAEALQMQQHGDNGQYTYEDYIKWSDDKRFELIDGVPYAMASPAQPHQDAVIEIGRQFANYLLGRRCKAFVAPFDVCLNAQGDKDRNVVQPDVFVVCDPAKLDGKRCNGAPDLVVEIVSPSSATRDWFIKLNKYRKAGVREYWIVDTHAKKTDVFLFRRGRRIFRNELHQRRRVRARNSHR
jgi:Uma2 family endonuclease